MIAFNLERRSGLHASAVFGVGGGLLKGVENGATRRHLASALWSKLLFEDRGVRGPDEYQPVVPRHYRSAARPSRYVVDLMDFRG